MNSLALVEPIPLSNEELEWVVAGDTADLATFGAGSGAVIGGGGLALKASAAVTAGTATKFVGGALILTGGGLAILGLGVAAYGAYRLFW